jgi:hypothetical protein
MLLPVFMRHAISDGDGREGPDMDLEGYVSDLERQIDVEQEARLLTEWIDFTENRCPDVVFTPHRRTEAQQGVAWPEVNVSAAIGDEDLMFLQQFGQCAGMLHCERGDGLLTGQLLWVRANYGTGILPTCFGAELFIMDRELNTLPTTLPLAAPDAISRLLDNGPPDPSAGLGAAVFHFGERLAGILQRHPAIAAAVHVVHPDLQGPMDVAELLWGSGIFVDVFDQPERVKALLDLICETYAVVLEKWYGIFPPPLETYAVHWGMLHKGRIMLRDDSAMNFSPAMYEEFIKPYDQRLLDALGGGAIHFCGRGEHFIESMSDSPGLHAVNMTQPELNNMDMILANTVDKGIKLLNLHPDATATAVREGRDLKHQVHCSGSASTTVRKAAS